MLGKKGLAPMFFFMVGVVFFLLGLALAPALTETINGDEVRGSDGLDCSNASISNDDRAVCYQVDTLTPLYIGVIFGLGAMLLTRIVT